MKIKINLKAIISGYLAFFAALMLIYCSVNVPGPTGEWDDYSLPIASILNDQNFSICESDVIEYKTLFPNWAKYIENYELSGYMTRSRSGEMPWYFPTYGIACIPFVLILQFLELPTIFAFPYTNLAIMMISLVYAFKCLNVDEKKKALLVCLLSINPIVFYMSWTSAEVYVYSMLVMGLTSWYNKWDKRAAIFVSIAGTLNPTIMSIGIVMILEYGVRIIKQKNLDLSWSAYIKKKIPEVFGYGCCYVIGIIPMIYNYYNMGHINLTASLGGFTHGTESTLSRFLAYLFDLNIGILPYFTVLFIISIILLIAAVIKRHIKYIVWITTFFINVALYSIMVHINCGLSGISRYNAWGVVILIFAVTLFYDEIITRALLKRICTTTLCVGLILTGTVVMNYNPYLASNTSCQSWTPIAEWFLDNSPELYNPLYSTFNSRTTHQDGAYGFADELPIVYTAKDGYVRKILATSANKDELLAQYFSCNGHDTWLAEKIDALEDDIGYISVPKEYEIIKASAYDLGTMILFSKEGNNASDYIATGFYASEDWGTWTEGNSAVIRYVSNSESDIISGTINCIVYNNRQDVIVYVNGKKVLYQDDFAGGSLKFSFDNPGKQRLVEIRIELPDAISPAALGYGDERTLGLGVQNVIFDEAEVSHLEGEYISFTIDGYNADKYIVYGLYEPEKWGSWTGNRAQIQFETDNSHAKLHISISAIAFIDEQTIQIFINGKPVYYGNFEGGNIEFDSDNNTGFVDLVIEVPDACSPYSIGQSDDGRVLGIGIESIRVSE